MREKVLLFFLGFGNMLFFVPLMLVLKAFFLQINQLCFIAVFIACAVVNFVVISRLLTGNTRKSRVFYVIYGWFICFFIFEFSRIIHLIQSADVNLSRVDFLFASIINVLIIQFVVVTVVLVKKVCMGLEAKK